MENLCVLWFTFWSTYTKTVEKVLKQQQQRHFIDRILILARDQKLKWDFLSNVQDKNGFANTTKSGQLNLNLKILKYSTYISFEIEILKNALKTSAEIFLRTLSTKKIASNKNRKKKKCNKKDQSSEKPTWTENLICLLLSNMTFILLTFFCYF